jgi:membrane-bound ClpP family serine protease
MNGFFAPYAYLGIVVFSVVIVFGFLLAWFFSKAFKTNWAYPMIMLLMAIIFYFFDVKLMTYVFLILFFISLLISLIFKYLTIKKNIN